MRFQNFLCNFLLVFSCTLFFLFFAAIELNEIPQSLSDPKIPSIYNSNSQNNIRIFCFVCTAGNTDAAIERSKMIAETWGKHCDRLVYFSPVQIGKTETIVLPRFPGESRSNLYPKVHYIWNVVANQYKDEADWFYKADDDTFLHVPNLKEYIRTHFAEESQPRFIGEKFKHPFKDGKTYASGGPGYAINRVALEKFLAESKNGIKGNCPSESGPEDTHFADCLDSLGIKVEDTSEEDGRERFLQIPLELRFETPKFRKIRWWKKRAFNFGNGASCCSERLIGVHKLSVYDLERYYFSFYRFNTSK